jgi:hypothetical protein
MVSHKKVRKQIRWKDMPFGQRMSVVGELQNVVGELQKLVGEIRCNPAMAPVVADFWGVFCNSPTVIHRRPAKFCNSPTDFVIHPPKPVIHPPGFVIHPPDFVIHPPVHRVIRQL